MLANKSYHQYLFKVLKEIDVYQHYQILLLVSRQGGRTTQKYICEILRIEKSNMVAMIALLEDKGYVTKAVNFKDRRGKLISLTQKADKLVNTMTGLFNALEGEIAEEVTWQEMHNCLRVLDKVNEMLNTMLTSDAIEFTISKSRFTANI